MGRGTGAKKRISHEEKVRHRRTNCQMKNVRRLQEFILSELK
jgi:hypothetical protein